MVAADLVTPDGSLVRAGEDGDPELLWALRGGGGNFGVVTELHVRLHPLEHVVGGMLEYRGDGVREVLRCMREIVAGAPRELSLQATLVAGPELVPGLYVLPCHTGPGDEPDAVRTLRALPGLVADSVRRQTFLEQQAVVDGPYGEVRHYWKGHFTDALPDDLIDVLLKAIVAAGRPPGQILIESLHGAPHDIPAAGQVTSYRDAAFNIGHQGAWLDPASDDVHRTWARTTAAAIEPWAVGGGYLNDMVADEPLERVRATFGAEAFARLQAVKRRYDPGNVLRRNQNIPPA